MKTSFDINKINDVFYINGMLLVDPFETIRRNLTKEILTKEELLYAVRLGFDKSMFLKMYRDIVYGTLFNIEKEDLIYVMTKEELDYLNSLPQQFTIYRYMTQKELKSGEFDCFWTLDENQAERIGQRFGIPYTTKFKKVIHSIEVDKDDVTAYFNANNESAIIYFQDKRVEV